MFSKHFIRIMENELGDLNTKGVCIEAPNGVGGPRWVVGRSIVLHTGEGFCSSPENIF